jgi:hypothetical protein
MRDKLTGMLKWMLPWIVLLFIAWRIWPTPYEYKFPEGSGRIVRIQRATGKTWVAVPWQGWRLLVPAEEIRSDDDLGFRPTAPKEVEK